MTARETLNYKIVQILKDFRYETFVRGLQSNGQKVERHRFCHNREKDERAATNLVSIGVLRTGITVSKMEGGDERLNITGRLGAVNFTLKSLQYIGNANFAYEDTVALSSSNINGEGHVDACIVFSMGINCEYVAEFYKKDPAKSWPIGSTKSLIKVY